MWKQQINLCKNKTFRNTRAIYEKSKANNFSNSKITLLTYLSEKYHPKKKKKMIRDY